MSSSKSRTYNSDESVVFHKTKESYGGLSNMAAGFPIYVHNTKILTSEALYQLCRFPTYPEIQHEIIAQTSPMHAKKIARHYESLTRKDWMLIRHKVMRWALRVKLSQNLESFGIILKHTGEKQIVEKSYKDDFWGAIPTHRDKKILIGQNVLGRLLMELREELNTNTPSYYSTIPSVNVENFLLNGNPIRQVDNIINNIGKPTQNQLL